MSTQNLHDGRIQLEAWGIAEFIREFQQLVKDGWWVDFEENDGYPINIGGLMHAKLVKVQPCEDFIDETEVSEEKDDEIKDRITDAFAKISDPANSEVFSKDAALKAFGSVGTEEKSAKIEAPKRGRPAKG